MPDPTRTAPNMCRRTVTAASKYGQEAAGTAGTITADSITAGTDMEGVTGKAVGTAVAVTEATEAVMDIEQLPTH
jgi:hypothetical protein